MYAFVCVSYVQKPDTYISQVLIMKTASVGMLYLIWELDPEQLRGKVREGKYARAILEGQRNSHSLDPLGVKPSWESSEPIIFFQ